MVSYPDLAFFRPVGSKRAELERPLARARTPKSLNLPNCLYIKETCNFFQSYVSVSQRALYCFCYNLGTDFSGFALQRYEHLGGALRTYSALAGLLWC